MAAAFWAGLACWAAVAVVRAVHCSARAASACPRRAQQAAVASHRRATLRLRPEHRFLLLASDGIIGPLEDASKDEFAERSAPLAWRVAAAQAAGSRAGDIAQGLVACAEREGADDNMTCLLLLLGAVPSGTDA